MAVEDRVAGRATQLMGGRQDNTTWVMNASGDGEQARGQESGLQALPLTLRPRGLDVLHLHGHSFLLCDTEVSSKVLPIDGLQTPSCSDL